jgi:putative ABC transport system permease protein
MLAIGLAGVVYELKPSPLTAVYIAMRLSQILRSLARMPLFTGVAVLTLAIGIGANTAIFSVVEGVLLKPLPYPRSGELVALDHAAPGINLPRTGAAPFLYFTYREEGRVFQDVGLWNTGTVSVTGLGEPEEVRTLFVTDGILPMLSVPPMLGRLFSKTDDSPSSPETVVLTAGYWRSKFGADHSAVGRTLMIDSKPREIIGVLPDTFRFLDRRVSLVLPFRFDRSKTFLGQFSFSGIGRLKPGTTIDEASADVARLIPISLTRFPPFPGGSVKMFEEVRLRPNVRSLKDELIGDVQTVLWVLMGTIGMVLVIACANVANLFLVRAESRQQELTIRAALGAGSARIARELLLESVTLGIAGGFVGLGLAFAALRLLVALAPGNLPRLDDIRLDLRVLVFALVLSVVAGLLFGAIPAFKYAGGQLATTLRGGGRTASASKERHRARNTLVVAQVALALVLLVSSGLMIRTFQALRDVHPGFVRPEELQSLRLVIPSSQLKEEPAVLRVHHSIMDKVAAVPGVASVALTSTVTMSGQGWHDPLFAQDRTYSESQVPPIRLFKFVSPGYMKTMGGSLVAGRDFTWAEVYDLRPVAMVSENLARELWGQPAAAIGKRIRPYPQGVWREVVGVLSDMRDDGLHQKAPTVAYWPLLMVDFTPTPDNRNFVQRGVSYVIRSSRTGSSGFVNELGHAVWSINPNLPLASVRTMQEIYDASLARTSFTLVMLGIAGGMALLLGVAGIYGVISYSVSQRTREIGIRIALGAQAQAITRMFVGHGLTLAGVGVAVGLTAAFGVMRLLSSLLFEVSPVDPLTYGMVSLTLIAATALASYVPALRATAVDPVDALRSE